jgi:CheY-like chemotaxis protein
MAARILVVDDNMVNLKLAAAVLAAEGHQVLRAMDAEQAQACLARDLPDLILMDIALPGMDGLMLTRIIKADDRLRHIPVIALTAFAMKGDDLKAREAGCDGYISKPIDTRALPLLIENALRQSAGRRRPTGAGDADEAADR